MIDPSRESTQQNNGNVFMPKPNGVYQGSSIARIAKQKLEKYDRVMVGFQRSNSTYMECPVPELHEKSDIVLFNCS